MFQGPLYAVNAVGTTRKPAELSGPMFKSLSSITPPPIADVLSRFSFLRGEITRGGAERLGTQDWLLGGPRPPCIGGLGLAPGGDAPHCCRPCLSPATPRRATASIFFGVQSLDENIPTFRNGIGHQPLECLSDRFADTLNDYGQTLFHAGEIARSLYGSEQKVRHATCKNILNSV